MRHHLEYVTDIYIRIFPKRAGWWTFLYTSNPNFLIYLHIENESLSESQKNE